MSSVGFTIIIIFFWESVKMLLGRNSFQRLIDFRKGLEKHMPLALSTSIVV